MREAIIILSIFILNLFHTNAQNFNKIELLRIENKLILQENYSAIKLPDEIAKGEKWNNYNADNPDTFLEILQDEHHSRCHILIQTDFFGNVEYVAVSNGLNAIINKKEKPKFVFEHCLQDLNNGFSNQQENILKIINCIVERLETCTQK